MLLTLLLFSCAFADPLTNLRSRVLGLTEANATPAVPVVALQTEVGLGVEDYENTALTAWWIYGGQSLSQISTFTSNNNARITSISVDTPSTFTATFVSNTGSYAKGWWWYVGIDAATVSANLNANGARLVSLNAYDIGGGNIRFAVVMISNTGADGKGWWWYYGQTAAGVSSILTSLGNARITSLQSYVSNGQTYYAVILIPNTGSDNRGWYWYYNVSPSSIAATVASLPGYRITQLTTAGGNNFNVILESCSGGCPNWRWFYGISLQQTLSESQNYGVRANTVSSYPCGSTRCYATTMISDSPPDVTSCDLNGCVSQATLTTNICNMLAGNVVGYSCAVGQVRPQFGGLARTATDGTLAMTPDLLTNIASVSKTITAVAVLQILAANSLPVTTYISSYIYPDWPQGLYWNQLTFKHLLTHSTGLTQSVACGTSITYSQLKSIVASNINPVYIGVPSYGNCNFALLRELLPRLQNLILQADGSARASQSSNNYINYVNAHVFAPLGIPTRTCTAPASGNILSYNFPAGTTPGDSWGDWSLSCGSGGWVISANDIFNVVNSIANDNRLLTQPQRQQMVSQCLGWDCAVRGDCPDGAACKNGDLYDSHNARVWTFAGIVDCNVPVVVVVNSDLPAPWETGEDIIGLVLSAYQSSTVAGSGGACAI